MLLFAIVMMAMSAMAETTTSYTDELKITVDNNEPVTQTTTISVTEKDNGKYKFTLTNFSFGNSKIGDIELEDIEGTEKDGIVTLTVKDVTTKIKNAPLVGFGNLINLAGGVNISMTAKIKKSANKMFADMTMKAAGQNIKAIFGDEKNITTSISNLPVDNTNDKVELFNLQGQRISEAKPGQVVIMKKGGKAVKVLK